MTQLEKPVLTKKIYEDILYDKCFTYNFSDQPTILYARPSIIDGTANIYPGSFNPLHFGHLYIQQTSCAIFEVSISRLNKEPYSFEEISDIINQFVFLKKVFIISNNPLMKDKKYFRNQTIVMGEDTYNKIDKKDLSILTDIIVFKRDKNIESNVRFMGVPEYLTKISSTQIRNSTE